MSAPAVQLALGDFADQSLGPDATIDERWAAFKAANPWVLPALDQLANEARRSGRRRVGAKELFERLRWQWERTTASDTEGWKLNNDFSSRAARDLLDAHPDWADAGFIETRQLKAP